jgi:TldD protein
MLKKELITQILEVGMARGADFAEVFVEEKRTNNLQMVGGLVEKATSAHVRGVGIRLAKKLQSVYGYTNQFTPEAMLSLAENLSKSFSGEATLVQPLNEPEIGQKHRVKINPKDVSEADKVALMKKAHEAAIGVDEVIQQVKILLLDSVQTVQIANSEGRHVIDERVRVRIHINAIAAKDNVMQTGGESPGSGKGYEFLFEDIDVAQCARDAAITAKTMLYAKECPSGVMPVIINNEFGGVIFHEACGHSLEATSVAKNASVFCGKLNQVVASPMVTAIDDGTIENAWGSANYDDEGYPQQRRILIENGVLKSYMVDFLNARRMDHTPTGSSRRESYKYQPTSRMSNTFIDNGTATFDEIIANTSYGLFAKKMGGGSVNPGTGDFNFAVSEGYLIRDGKIAEPVRGASLVGNGADILMKIDMIGNNLASAQGMCGSASGSIPANVGQPTIRVSAITVGGKKGAE